uniref:Uncharacterized protein n=1 Tax=uncultured prokaryote TaxID=198431 RepID=A0A0H5PWM7_9ZZZZ|nr:hypothetical protein [uncultured prokaryote]
MQTTFAARIKIKSQSTTCRNHASGLTTLCSKVARPFGAKAKTNRLMPKALCQPLVLDDTADQIRAS